MVVRPPQLQRCVLLFSAVGPIAHPSTHPRSSRECGVVRSCPPAPIDTRRPHLLPIHAPTLFERVWGPGFCPPAPSTHLCSSRERRVFVVTRQSPSTTHPHPHALQESAGPLFSPTGPHPPPRSSNERGLRFRPPPPPRTSNERGAFVFADRPPSTTHSRPHTLQESAGCWFSPASPHPQLIPPPRSSNMSTPPCNYACHVN